MVSIVLTLALLLASAKGLTTPKQSSNVGRIVTLLPTASESVNTSQIQSTLQTQGLSIPAVRLSSTALNTKSNASTSPRKFSVLGEITAAPVYTSIVNDAVQFADFANILISSAVSIVVGTSTPIVQSQYVYSAPSTIPKSSSTTRKLNLHPPKSEVQPLSHGSTVTRDSGRSSPVLDLQVSSGKATVTSSPSSPFLGAESTGTPALIISSQTITADSQHRHSLLDGETLNPGSTTTMVSLAPDRSDVVVGTSKEALSTNIKAGFGAGPNVTAVQTFKGSALGTSNGLWSSLMGFFVGIAVLLWL